TWLELPRSAVPSSPELLRCGGHSSSEFVRGNSVTLQVLLWGRLRDPQGPAPLVGTQVEETHRLDIDAPERLRRRSQHTDKRRADDRRVGHGNRMTILMQPVSHPIRHTQHESEKRLAAMRGRGRTGEPDGALRGM